MTKQKVDVIMKIIQSYQLIHDYETYNNVEKDLKNL